MKVCFIGLGSMGRGMALNILKAGHDLTVFNRTADRAESLVAQGAGRADAPAKAAAGSDVIVSCVSDTPDVEAVLIGDDGVIHGARKGAVVVDCSTISPKGAREIGQKLIDAGLGFLDAPVSGGTEGADKGTLSIMIGGEQSDVDKARPVLEAMGRAITHVGPLGAGQLTKAVNQVVCAGNYLAAAEGLVLGLKAGLDMDQVLTAIRGGAAGSWVLDNRAANMINNEYPLGFRARLHRKDLKYALQTADELGVALPVSALAVQMQNALIAQGFGEEDVTAMTRCLRQWAGME